MAKKKLMSYREWQQLVSERKARAKARRAEAKHAKLEAYWAVPAPSNYVKLEASWLNGHLHVHGQILPDKRYRKFSHVGISLVAAAGADREAIAQQLTALAQAVLTSEEPWATANGAPVSRPVTIEGASIRLVPQEPWQPHRDESTTQPTPVSPRPPTEAHAPPEAEHPSAALLRLRTQLQRWLSAHRTDESPLALLTVEQLAEVLLMRVCGDDIALVSERDPWRWDHTAEEIRAAEERLAGEVETLSGLVTDLNGRLGPEAAIAALLTVFVQGQGG